MKKLLAVVIVLLVVPLTTSAQDFCEGNFDYDEDQDGTDAFTFKTDFGRSAFKNPCPPDGPAPVPKTGQTTTYATGDDGDLQRGVAWPNTRFTDNLDGTVRDNMTGLIWLKDANCFGSRTWNDALSDANGLESGECGLTDGSNAGDWRLPNRRELLSLIDDESYNPALPSGHPFTNVPIGYFWSSTTDSNNNAYAWYVYVSDGKVDNHDKARSDYVWPIRGGH